MLADPKQIDKRTTMKNQKRTAALGRPAMKLQRGRGGGASTSLQDYLFLFVVSIRAKLSLAVNSD